MTEPRRNHLGQPIGPAVQGWVPPPVPGPTTLRGRTCRLEPLDPERHGRDLFEAYALDADGAMWTYLPNGPYASVAELQAWLRPAASSSDPLHLAVVDERTQRAVGTLAYLRMQPADGCIEIGHVTFSPLLRRTTAATEAFALMAANAFALGYRRYEWKCDSLNEPSRAAAQRLGFTYEGVFRKDRIYRGRSRDTAWFSIIDEEWPLLQRAYDRWLAPENFEDGTQRRTLSELRQELAHP